MAKKSTRSIQKRRYLKHFWFRILAFVLVSISVCAVAFHFAINDGNDAFYFVDSQYKHVQSRFVTEKTASLQSTIEYPITKNAAVTATIADAIDTASREFIEQAHQPALRTEPFTQNISYQVPYTNKQYMSIVVTIYQDSHGAHPVSQALYWTFDMHTGKAVTTAELLGNSPDGMARILMQIKRAVRTKVVQHGGVADDEFLDELITPSAISMFTVIDRHTVEFPFGKGVVAAESDGPISVRLSTDSLQLFLQNTTARGIFDVTPISVMRSDNSHTLSQAPGAPIPADICKTSKCIALTYDDGPSLHTRELLKTLKNHNAKASFFMIGRNVAKLPEIAKQVSAEGHTIGNHSYNHASLPLMSQARIMTELESTNQIIEKTTGKKPTLARPPYGAVDAKTYQALATLKMSAVLWSIDTRDWADRDASIVCNRVVAGAQAGGIVIMHDIHLTTVAAAECILSTLEKQGFTFVGVDTLLGASVQPGQGYYKVD